MDESIIKALKELNELTSADGDFSEYCLTYFSNGSWQVGIFMGGGVIASGYAGENPLNKLQVLINFTKFKKKAGWIR